MKKIERKLSQARKNPGLLFNEAKRRFQYKPKFSTKSFCINPRDENKKIKSPECSSVKQNKQKNDHQSNESSWLDKFVSGFDCHNKLGKLQQKNQKKCRKSLCFGTNVINEQKSKIKKIEKVLKNRYQPKSFCKKAYEKQAEKKKSSKTILHNSIIQRSQSIEHHKTQVNNRCDEYEQYLQSDVQCPKLFNTKRSPELSTQKNQQGQLKFTEKQKKLMKTKSRSFEVTILKVEQPIQQLYKNIKIPNRITLSTKTQKLLAKEECKIINKVQPICNQIKVDRNNQQIKRGPLKVKNINQNGNAGTLKLGQIIENNIYKQKQLNNSQSMKFGKIKKNKTITDTSTSSDNILINVSPIKHKSGKNYTENDSRIYTQYDQIQRQKLQIINQTTKQNRQTQSPQKSIFMRNKIIQKSKQKKYLPDTIFQVQEQDLGQTNTQNKIDEKLTVIYEQLNSKLLSYIDKNNCNINNLKDQIRYLIGSILSKIKYKNQKYTLKQFISAGKLIINSLEPYQVNKLLKSSVSNQSVSLETKRSKISKSLNSVQCSSLSNLNDQSFEKLRNKNLSQSNIKKYSGEDSNQDKKMNDINQNKIIRLDQIPSKKPYLETTYLDEMYSLSKEEFKMIDLLNDKLTRYIHDNKLKDPKSLESIDNIKLDFAELRKHLRQ